MKRVIFLLIATMFSFTFYTINSHAELTETEEMFILTITKDFTDTYNINLNGYNFFDMKEIYLNKDNLTTQEKSLKSILMNIAKKQYFMDCSPIFYIDETNNKGYVFEKKLRGMNNLYILSYDDASQNWKVTKNINKMGKNLVDLGLLKSAK